ncbi:MAG: hypothetical protein CMG94_05960 [Marinoscillum sp.]|nr:hypothetical protein [Marinoscillum sp.]OUX26156.1 MAG: hypothetical protein CBE22_03475 [Flammeovirgaceae bacterium TMED262]
MNKIIIMFLSLLTFFIITSCKNVENTKLISKDKMVSILLEMHLKEESIMLLKLPNDTSDVFFSEIESEVFDKFMVDEELYRKSYSYYFFRPEELESIYVKVIDSLSLYQQLKE